MAEVNEAELITPMIITPAHKQQPMNPGRADEILAHAKPDSIIPTLLRVDTVAGNWYLLERTIFGQWLLKSGTGGLPHGITFTQIRDGQLYTADGQKYTQKIVDIFETDERGKPIASLK